MPITRATITTAEARYPDRKFGTAAECYVKQFWKGPLPTEVRSDVPTYTWIIHGRWIVFCPSPNCNNAQIASREDHRFFCTQCGNAAVDGAWLVVEWPADADAIEAVVGARPHKVNRNWLITESIDDLRAENAAHNVR